MNQETTTIVESGLPDAEEPRPAEPAQSTLAAALADLRQELVGGLLYTHDRANANTGRVLETAAFLYALIELLQEHGLIAIAELDERKTTVAQRLEQRFRDKGMGVHLQEPERDKYTVQGAVQIDCENRVHLCKAACCRLWFPLSQQDVEEGVVRWDLRQPYIIAQDAQGYCQHLDRGTCRCGIYAQRPLPCRVFDCRKDKRIWLDFEHKVINPKLEDMFQGRVPAEP
jgi:Fe-S-cluster containining protein